MVRDNGRPTSELEVWARMVGGDLEMWRNWLQADMDQLNETMVTIRKTGLDVPDATKAVSMMFRIARDMEIRVKEFKRIEKLDGK